MDYLPNASLPCDYQQDQVLSPPLNSPRFSGFSSTLDDLLASRSTEADVSLEWLSVFVEDCLSSKGSCLPPPTDLSTSHNTKPSQFQNSYSHPLPNFTVPGKPRSKRSERPIKRKLHPNKHYTQNLFQAAISLEPPPLLNQRQPHWLADSELVVVPKKEERRQVEGGKERRCRHCLSQRTPQWRAGPLGPKTLCNACGVRFKSGRLLPEYRPAKSPTFVSFLHSNSHKKVMEMRNMTTLL